MGRPCRRGMEREASTEVLVRPWLPEFSPRRHSCASVQDSRCSCPLLPPHTQ